MRISAWGATAGWLGCAAVAVLLVLAAPQERHFLGQLPSVSAHARDRGSIQLPQQLPAERTLVLLVFNQTQRAEARSWIDGLQLRDKPGIPWVKMHFSRAGPVQLASHGTGSTPPSGRAMTLQSDAETMVQALRLTSAEHAHVLVLDRDGNVLAKAEGAFDEDKASAMLETLAAE